MNIFVLDKIPHMAARYHCDKHVVKMILETAQILSTVIHKSYPDGFLTIYRPTHKNHPCTLWAGESYANMSWLYNLGMALCHEFYHRYGGEHKSKFIIWKAGRIMGYCDYNKQGMTPFAQAMPDKYKQKDAVQAYRNYYKYEKTKLLTYTKREVPEWLKE
jgi:hypothetical protein